MDEESLSGCLNFVSDHNRGLVVYAWFLKRNIQIFINIFPPLYLSRFFFRYGGNAQFINTELHYLHFRQSSFPLAVTV